MARAIDADALLNEAEYDSNFRLIIPADKVKNAPNLTPLNEPLTLNELREMDGEPVWVDDEKTWAILQVWDDQNIDAVFSIQRGCFRAESVLGMKIYRRPPEGEEYT